jgi:hypothetical protein
MRHEQPRTVGEIVFLPFSETMTLGDTLVMYACFRCGAAVPWIAGRDQDVYLGIHADFHTGKPHPLIPEPSADG